MMTDNMGLPGGFFAGDFLFQLFPIFFIIVLGIILFSFFRGIKEWNNNNQQPKLSVAAILVAKRTRVRRHGGAHNHDHHHHSHTSTDYFCTFEVESGDRMEFMMKEGAFGLLAEGDKGKLTFQGTRFLGFERRE
ncbi:DUF2500 domain-containing protein [Sutcliffiella sp. NPDC057660]|uniref:DUF2500 domain-containing protein n=1 Tax=Sutcliffiella sp. NPDC057660 TaxID=3346199 RepID=UPI003688353E